MQSTGHLLGMMAFLLPLALLGFERGRDGDARWLTLGAAALVAVPLTGQLHLALGAIPFVLAYGLLRARERPARRRRRWRARPSRRWAGLVVQHAVIRGSVASGGRSLGEVAAYSADWSGFVSRHAGPLEEFTLLGWLTPLLAVAGFAALIAQRSPRLAALLGIGVVVPGRCSRSGRTSRYTSSCGTTSRRSATRACRSGCCRSPASRSRRWPRSPSTSCARRCSPRSRSWRSTVDLRAGVSLYRPAKADTENAAYTALRSRGPGRLLELPVFIPQRQYGSVYLAYSQQAPRERPGGYSSTAPRSAEQAARELVPLNCGAWSPELRRRTYTHSASAT